MVIKIQIHKEAPPLEGCHSSTVTALPDGSAFAVWFQGTYEGADDVRIMGAHIKDAVFRNLTIGQVVKMNNYPHWNPVISWYNGKLNLFFRVGESPRNWKTWLMTGKFMADGNVIWSNQPKEVDFGPVKNKPIQLSDNIMLAGDSEESSTNWFAKIHRYTPDNKWLGTAIIPRPKNVGMIQPTVWESNDGEVHAIMRTTVGELYRSDSNDYGRTWCLAYGIGLPNNNSSIDIIKHKFNDELTMIWNPIYSPGISAERRGVLSLIHSTDNGGTWGEMKNSNLEVGQGEYSYPSIIEDDGGELHITYTLKRKNIIYRRM